ncbi:hypothetical protein A2U01_0103248, partial [Trifolium medium]|nr:hypothetical protein [Trifolium medium]
MDKMEAPHEVELSQEFPCTKEADTVDNEVVMMDVKEVEGLLGKEESIEQKEVLKSKA